MRSVAAFFRHVGARRIKTAGGRIPLPQVLAALNRLGLEHGVIDPEVAAAHGVLPEDVVLPVHEAPTPPPVDMEEVAKEEVLSLLRNAATSPVSAVPVPGTPAGAPRIPRPEPPVDK